MLIFHVYTFVFYIVIFVELIIIAMDIIKRIATIISIAKTVVTESAISISISEKRLSLMGSIREAEIFSISIIAAIFIIGTAQITITDIIPAVPTAFFISLVLPITVSMLSERKLPTTGTMLPTANFAVFIMRLSTVGVQKP